MRVLWVCNIMLPAFARANNLPWSDREGWLSGAYDRISSGKKSGNVTLGVAFPADNLGKDAIEIDGVKFYGFCENLNTPEIYDEKLEGRFGEIYEDFKPDIIHVFGTEFPHSLAAIKVFDKPEKTLLGIQGICGAISKLYMAGLPESVYKDTTFRDRYKNDSLVQQQEKFEKRAENERKAIMLTGHITGRTDFDKEATAAINPKAKYHKMNETMRPTFYKGAWRSVNTVSHSIFLSQGDYPLKGFHFVLNAMPKILEKYPDAHLYVAGNNIIGRGESKYPYFMRASAYGKYIKSLIARGHLKKKVTMVGMLNDQEMKEQYLKCSVFVCPSVIENSPNSLGEAMLLGVPVAASRTGGIPDMVSENKDGVLFEKGNVDDLVKAILQIWDEPVIAAVYGDNAAAHARITHNADTNFKRLIEIYKDIDNR